MGVPMGTSFSAAFWLYPISMRRSSMGMVFSLSASLMTWGGSAATTPKMGGSVRIVSSRSGSILGSTPPIFVKRRNPSSMPLTIRPISSRCAVISTFLAFFLPQRFTPTRLPILSIHVSSHSGSMSSRAFSTTLVSKPEGPHSLHSAFMVSRKSIGSPFYFQRSAG